MFAPPMERFNRKCFSFWVAQLIDFFFLLLTDKIMMKRALRTVIGVFRKAIIYIGIDKRFYYNLWARTQFISRISIS